MSIIVDLEIYSPRWGHDDTYSVRLEMDSMEISMNARKAKAKWIERLDPEWSGDQIENIMRNDRIYPPGNIRNLFEHVWEEWRSEEITDEEAEAELKELANWLNTITRSKPDTEFWNQYF